MGLPSQTPAFGAPSAPGTAAPAPPTARSVLAALRRGVALPRSTRDVLFLLVVIAWTLVPHAAHLPPWCGALACAVLLWRARLALAQAPLPRRRWLLALLAGGAGLTAWSHGTLLGRDAGVTLLVVLMALKTLELHARRDALVVFFLGFFLVLTNFLYAQTPAVGAAMALSTWGLLTALVLAHRPLGRPLLREAARTAAAMLLHGAPVALLLFLLFPRLGPLWSLPVDVARTGLSGTLDLGGMAQVARDDRIALRVRFEDGAAPPSAPALYWRGPVLSAFDGRTWQPRPDRGQLPPLQLHGPGLAYEMRLEPAGVALLPLLELSPVLDTPGLGAQLGPQLQWSLPRPPADPLRLRARAWPVHELGPVEQEPSLREDVALPPGRSPRTQQWAAGLRRRLPQADTPALVQAVLAHIRGGGYRYTLAPVATEPAADPVDAFWLDRREGFCEHFASSFVVVMRALDVPARVVAGFQGAEGPDAQGWWTVRNSHAHAWAEVWIAGRGWQRVDPTAAVAPERVQRGALLHDGEGLLAQALHGASPALLARWRALQDGLDRVWHRHLVHYSRSEQAALLHRLGWPAPQREDLWRLLAGALALVALAVAAVAARRPRPRDPWQRLQPRLRRALRRLGVADGAAHETPRALAHRVQAALGPRGAPLASRLLALERLRYGPGAAPDAAALRAWWRDFSAAATQAGIEPVAGSPAIQQADARSR